eukprot:1522667-Amphidinium_carterae.2
MKGADVFLLHRVAARGPLGVHTQVPSGEIHRREVAGTPDLPELLLGSPTIAHDIVLGGLTCMLTSVQAFSTFLWLSRSVTDSTSN